MVIIIIYSQQLSSLRHSLSAATTKRNKRINNNNKIYVRQLFMKYNKSTMNSAGSLWCSVSARRSDNAKKYSVIKVIQSSQLVNRNDSIS